MNKPLFWTVSFHDNLGGAHQGKEVYSVAVQRSSKVRTGCDALESAYAICKMRGVAAERCYHKITPSKV